MMTMMTKKEKRWHDLNRLELDLSEQEYDLRQKLRLLKDFEADYGYTGSRACQLVAEASAYFQGSDYANQVAYEEESVRREFYDLAEALAERDRQLGQEIGGLEDKITQVIIDKRRISLEE